jgi:hypothetical protein
MSAEGGAPEARPNPSDVVTSGVEDERRPSKMAEGHLLRVTHFFFVEQMKSK